MTTEQKIAYRQVISEVLMYMAEHGQDRHEVLTVLDRLETDTGKLIHATIQSAFDAPLREKQELTNQEKQEFRMQIATALELISRQGTTPQQVMEQIHGIETLVDRFTENHMRIYVGKPKFKITRGLA